jgi:dephospho-CoA kinase
MQQAVVLTGGIGSGKSEVGRLLAALGAHVVDADELARTVVQPGTAGLAAVAAAFGPRVIASDGTLNRPELATMVFGHPEQLAALEAIVHPLVEALAVSELAAGAGAPMVVYEVPLLGRLPEFPATAASTVVVVVDAPDAVRVERLRQRGLSEEQISARMAAQPSREAWISAADRLVDNGGDLNHLKSQVEALWRDLTMSEPPNASAPVTPAG